MIGIEGGRLLCVFWICEVMGLGIGLIRRRLVLRLHLVYWGLSIGWRRQIESIILA